MEPVFWTILTIVILWVVSMLVAFSVIQSITENQKSSCELSEKILEELKSLNKIISDEGIHIIKR
jgi:hypothetical protein